MIFKTACRTLRSGWPMHLATVLQLTAALLLTAVMVSSISLRFERYTPFREAFESKGLLIAYPTQPNAEREDGMLYPVTAEEKMMSYFPQAQQILSSYGTGITYETNGGFYKVLAYGDDILNAYTPMLAEGRWLSPQSTSDMPEVVVSNHTGNTQVGDAITVQIDYEQDGQWLKEDMQVKVVGMLEDGAQVAGLTGTNAGATADTFHLFYRSYSESIDQPLMIFSRTQLEAHSEKTQFFYSGTMMVLYEDTATEDVLKEGAKGASALGAVGKPTAWKLEIIDENSKLYLYHQVFNLLPIIVVLLILTAVSSISSSALGVRSRLRDYTVFYLTGLRWKQCALINLTQSLMIGGAAVICTGVAWIILQNTALGDSIRLIFNLSLAGTLAGVVMLYLCISMLMPLLIIGKNTPKEILTQA